MMVIMHYRHVIPSKRLACRSMQMMSLLEGNHDSRQGRSREGAATYLARPVGSENIDDLSRFNVASTCTILTLQRDDPFIPTLFERFHCHRAADCILLLPPLVFCLCFDLSRPLHLLYRVRTKIASLAVRCVSLLHVREKQLFSSFQLRYRSFGNFSC